jgi:hypothetical protein
MRSALGIHHIVPPRLDAFYCLVSGDQGGVSVAPPRHNDLGAHAAEDSYPNAPGCRLQLIEAGSH